MILMEQIMINHQIWRPLPPKIRQTHVCCMNIYIWHEAWKSLKVPQFTTGFGKSSTIRFCCYNLPRMVLNDHEWRKSLWEIIWIFVVQTRRCSKIKLESVDTSTLTLVQRAHVGHSFQGALWGHSISFTIKVRNYRLMALQLQTS